MSGAAKVLLSVGHGYSAGALGRHLLTTGGWRIIGTTRSPERAESLRRGGVEPLLWPGDGLEAALEQATHLLCSAGPDEAGDPLVPALETLLPKAGRSLVWAGYLSTTGVYGDHGGGWVDEDTALTPSTRRGAWRVAAERQWQALAARTGLPLHIFRLAGIYGPGRGPFEKLRRGTARRIVKPGQIFSRIHVEDIAGALAASMARPSPGSVWNLCDDQPAPPEEVILAAARMLGLPPPPAEDFASAEMTPMARSFYAESKRVRNDRIKALPGFALAHPGYLEGLAAVLRAETAQATEGGARPEPGRTI